MEVAGKTLLRWAWDSLVAVPLVSETLIATDDDRIVAWAQENDLQVTRTSDTCRNGTERVAEIARDKPADYYVNIQSDQVGLEPRAISELIRYALAHQSWDMATLATRTGVGDALSNPDRVTVRSEGCCCGDKRIHGRAHSFSRGGADLLRTSSHGSFRHIGVYGYKPAALKAYALAPTSVDEEALGLEQCRAVDLGFHIGVVHVLSHTMSCDRREDAADIESRMVRLQTEEGDERATS
jgi:3-deoxy-manno-octulosonate cytidylyltransferase (CMP-KDO synthetase)